MRLFLALMTLLCVWEISHTQSYCTYVPAQFVDANFEWRHYTVDSSIIGYSDGFFEFDENEHLFFQGCNSLIHEQKLYSIYPITLFNLSHSGFLLEKIDLATGQLEWKRAFDIRSSPVHESFFDISIQDDKIIVDGLYPVSNDRYLFAFGWGVQDGKYFRREISIIDGSSSVVLFSDSLYNNPPILHNTSIGRPVAFPFLEKRQDTFYQIRFELDNEIHLTKQLTLIDGTQLSGVDTFSQYEYNDLARYNSYLNISGIKYVYDSEDNWYFLERFIPSRDTLSIEAVIKKFDPYYNQIDEYDLSGILNDDKEYVTNELFLIGIHDKYVYIDQSLESNDRFIHVYDLESRTLDRTVRLSEKNNRLFFVDVSNIHIDNKGKVVFFDRSQLSGPEQSSVYVYRENDHHELVLTKELKFVQDRWVGFVEDFLELDNGDFLLMITHSCWRNNRKNS